MKHLKLLVKQTATFSLIAIVMIGIVSIVFQTINPTTWNFAATLFLFLAVPIITIVVYDNVTVKLDFKRSKIPKFKDLMDMDTKKFTKGSRFMWNFRKKR